MPPDVLGSLCAPAASREVVWRELIARVRSGDQDALAALYDETSRLVYGLTLRMLGNTADAEEVTLQIWRVWPFFITRQKSLDLDELAAIVKSLGEKR
jgi:hypothetical protein